VGAVGHDTANVTSVGTYRLRSASTPAIKVGKSTESARASRSTLTIPTLRRPRSTSLITRGSNASGGVTERTTERARSMARR
jgi:hypothetical protein